ncbi:hypothetical protein GGS20DRAFT_595943 [Poronia punctata]|nr:hypothetical protein GGS20DRAFT_595943 [Poronia punctata]
MAQTTGGKEIFRWMFRSFLVLLSADSPTSPDLSRGEVILALVNWWDNGLTFSHIGLKSLADPFKHSKLVLFLDSELLLNETQAIGSGIAAQVLQRYALVARDGSAKGICIYRELRLHIQPVSLWLLVADFVLLSLLTVSLIFLIPSESTL